VITWLNASDQMPESLLAFELDKLIRT